METSYWVTACLPSLLLQNETLAELARGNPQWPQAFYPLKRVIEIHQGDYVHARCTFDSTGRNRTTRIGEAAGSKRSVCGSC